MRTVAKAANPAVAAALADREGPGATAPPAPAAAAARLPGTPGSWRVASLAMLGGGFAVGGRMALRNPPRLVTSGLVAVAGVTIAAIARASRRPPLRPAVSAAPTVPASQARPTFSVIVAARDEVSVLPRIVADVAAQDHRDAAGVPWFELIVIDDRSTDGSAAAVRESAEEAGIGAVTRVVRRDGEHLPDGKGAALTACQPGDCTGDVVVVLDADARVSSIFLSTLAAYFERGAAAITPRRRTLDAGLSSLAQAQADEQTLDGELQRARWSMGGCSEFRGNGIVVRRDLLAAVGGWRAEALTEDLDLSSRVAARTGVRVAWALDAEVWEEPVTTWPALWRQRMRWAEGGLRRVLEHGPAVVRSTSLPIASRLDFAAYAGQLLAPPILLGSLAIGAIGRRPRAGISLFGGYFAFLATLAFDALRWEPETSGRPLAIRNRLRRSLVGALFSSVWLAAVPVAMWRLATRRGPVGYDKMPHAGIGGRTEPSPIEAPRIAAPSSEAPG
jgi:1,2-diacylglycerol 3-beta-glucosyltransferase